MQPKQEQLLAAQLQASLLPAKNFTAGGLCLDYFWQPASFLTGDSFDFFTPSFSSTKNALMQPTWQVFYLADVSGSGAAPALLTSWLKACVRQLDFSQLLNAAGKLSPALICAQVNTHLLELEVSKHLTLIMGVYQQEKRSLQLCNAGNLPVPVGITKNKKAWLGLEKAAISPALGMFPNATYKDYTCSFPEDGTLILATDGVLELLAMQEKQPQEAWQSLISSTAGDLKQLAVWFKTHAQPWPDDLSVITLSG